MVLRLALIALLSSATCWAGPPGLCEPPAEIRAELEKAAALPIADPTVFEQNVAPFQALRDDPGNLFVHERYQDAVQQYGIEGHLRQLTQDYQNLTLDHSGDLMYRYLFARSLIGRETVSALQQLNGILAERPDFAAHRALAEIYGSETFNDADKEKIEREKLSSLCPGVVLARRPVPLPEPSPLIERAEKLLLQDGEPAGVAAMALEGLQADEWRLHVHIRPLDWYSVEYKRQSQRELHAEYWRVWSLQVRCYRKAGRLKEAARVLLPPRHGATRDAGRQFRSQLLGCFGHAGPSVYAEAGQKTQAAQKLDDLQQFMARHPDNSQAAQLDDLRQLIAASGEPAVRTESGSLGQSSER